METASTADDADRNRSHPANSDVRLLSQTDVRRLHSLIPPSGFELNSVALLKRLMTVGLDGRVVDEDILTPIARADESEPLRPVEPLYYSLHVYSIFHFLHSGSTPSLKQTVLPKEDSMCSPGVLLLSSIDDGTLEVNPGRRL